MDANPLLRRWDDCDDRCPLDRRFRGSEGLGIGWQWHAGKWDSRQWPLQASRNVENSLVRTVSIVSGNGALAAAAVRAIRQWQYRPYLKDGQPVVTETNIVISFLSNDAISMTYPPSIPAR